jgi:hypothetical protein
MHTIQTSLPWVGFEPTISVFERALDSAATVIRARNEYVPLSTYSINRKHKQVQLLCKLVFLFCTQQSSVVLSTWKSSDMTAELRSMNSFKEHHIQFVSTSTFKIYGHRKLRVRNCNCSFQEFVGIITRGFGSVSRFIGNRAELHLILAL